jgi:hypothetical protein
MHFILKIERYKKYTKHIIVTDALPTFDFDGVVIIFSELSSVVTVFSWQLSGST